MKRLNFIIILLMVMFAGRDILPQGAVNFVNYGPKSELKEGDDDFVQVIFLVIPEDESGSFTVKLFDIDCGHELDLTYEVLDSKFKFSVYGGKGVFTAPTITSHHPTKDDLYKGTLIDSLVVGKDEKYDSKWVDFIKLTPEQGELVDGFYYFKLIMEGIEGDDANEYNVEARFDSNDKVISMINYCPTFRLPAYNKPVRARFTPDKEIVNVYNFDQDGGRLKFVTPYRSNIRLTRSYEGQWAHDKVALEHYEAGEVNEIEFGPGINKINDISFYAVDEEGSSYPFEVPLIYPVPNNKPVIKKEITLLDDCRTYVYDASGSSDPDQEELSYNWYLDKKLLGTQSKLQHTFDSSGTYTVILTVQDNSKSVENGFVENIKTVVNESPVANAGEDIRTIPGKSVRFDAKNSSDSDGRIKSYKWSTGDGASSTARRFSHSYAKPGTYTAVLVVTDNSGTPCDWDSDSISVFVNAPPVADAGKDIIGAPGESINFNGEASSDKDGEIVSYAWQFGDGQTGSGRETTHTYQNPGKYTAKLTVKDNSDLANNTASDKIVVIINSPPVAVAGNDILAAPEDILKFSGGKSFDSDGNITGYEWDFGDGRSAKGKDVTHAYAKPGKYTAVLKVMDNSPAMNNSATDSRTIVINSPPVPVPGKDIYQTKPVVTFNGLSSYDEDGDIVAYKWDFGDGFSSTNPKSEHYYSEPGEYKVSLTVTDNTSTKNNTAQVFITVKINAKPIADAGPDITVSPGEQFILSGSNSIDPDGKITGYSWSFNNESISTDDSFQHTINKPGLYNVTLKVEDDSRHEEAWDYDNAMVHVNARPVAVAGPDIHTSPGEPFTLDASKSYDVDGGVSAYSWELGNGNTSPEQVVVHSIDEPGIYSIRLNVTDNSGTTNSTGADELIVKINSAPIPKVNNEISTCDKLVTFDASGSADSDGDPLTYSWDFGDTSEKDYGSYLIHRYERSGTYPVILTVDDGHGLKNSVVTAAVNVRINSAPVAVCGENENVCSGEKIILSATDSYDDDGDLLKYYWDFGDGSTAEGISAVKSYPEAGLYTVTLKVVDNSGLDCNFSTDTKLLNVYESPVANAGQDLIGCSGIPVTFDGSLSTDSDGIVNSIHWDFGDGSFGGGVTTTHTYKNAGVYKVYLNITGELIGDCENSDTDELIVTITDAPSAEFSSPDSIALGTPATFDASISSAGSNNILSYAWDFGDDSTATGPKQTHLYENYGVYKIKLEIDTDSKSQCNQSFFEKNIYVNSRPHAEAGNDKVAGLNKSVVFDAAESYDVDGAISKYTWEFGDGESGKGKVAEHSYSEPGDYFVVLKVTDNTPLGNNSDFDTLKVTVNNPPVPIISGQPYTYIGEAVTFDASSSYDPDGEVVFYRWLLDGKILGSSSKLEHRFSEPGLYDISLVVIDNSAMKDSVSITENIRIYKIPDIQLSGGQILCDGDYLSLEAQHDMYNNPSGLTYNWETSTGEKIPGDSTLTIAMADIKDYSIRLSLTDPVFEKPVLSTVEYDPIINTAPVAAAEADSLVYSGGANDIVTLDGSASFDPDGDPLSYSWDLGDGNTAAGSIVSHNYAKPGKYKIKLVVSDNKPCDCSSAEDVIYIEVRNRK